MNKTHNNIFSIAFFFYLLYLSKVQDDNYGSGASSIKKKGKQEKGGRK
jgi:hypothetical protein